MLEHHNIITYKETAIEHADKLVPITRQFIQDLTSLMSPDDYKGQLNEFIEMVIAGMTYTSASLLLALFDMFPDLPMNTLSKNFKKSLDASIDLQMRTAYEKE